MPIETAADRAVFVDDDEFGAVVAWTRGATTSTFNAIYDADYALLSTPLLEAGAEAATPSILVRSSDLPAGASQGDAVAVSRRDDAGDIVAVGSFVAVEVKPDGTGMTTVRLQEA